MKARRVGFRHDMGQSQSQRRAKNVQSCGDRGMASPVFILADLSKPTHLKPRTPVSGKGTNEGLLTAAPGAATRDTCSECEPAAGGGSGGTGQQHTQGNGGMSSRRSWVGFGNGAAASNPGRGGGVAEEEDAGERAIHTQLVRPRVSDDGRLVSVETRIVVIIATPLPRAPGARTGSCCARLHSTPRTWLWIAAKSAADEEGLGFRTYTKCRSKLVLWSEDVVKAGPCFGRSRVRFRRPPWGSNTIARDHLT